MIKTFHFSTLKKPLIKNDENSPHKNNKKTTDKYARTQ